MVLLIINLILLGGSMYSEIIVTYDIEDNKNRKKLFEELSDLGLKPIQKSVFWGHVLVVEKRVIISLFKKYCDKHDKAIMSNVQLKNNLDNSFGYSKDDFSHPNEFKII